MNLGEAWAVVPPAHPSFRAEVWARIAELPVAGGWSDFAFFGKVRWGTAVFALVMAGCWMGWTYGPKTAARGSAYIASVDPVTRAALVATP